MLDHSGDDGQENNPGDAPGLGAGASSNPSSLVLLCVLEREVVLT